MTKLDSLPAPVVLDGAMGTELERRGFNARLPLWSAWALIEAPDLVRRIHSDYVRAGARVLSAATFRCTRHTLCKAPVPQSAANLAKLAIRLAREAAKHSADVLVAGSIAPLEDCYHPEAAPSDDVLAREHEDSARLLAEAGADLLLVETQNSRREAAIATRAARKTALPVWVSLMPRSEIELFNGDSLLDTAHAVAELGVDAILVNCCPPPVAESALRTLRKELPDMRLGVYPNFSTLGGRPEEFTSVLTTQAFAIWASRLAPDAAILGGCCGTTPEHIAALARVLHSQRSSQ